MSHHLRHSVYDGPIDESDEANARRVQINVALAARPTIRADITAYVDTHAPIVAADLLARGFDGQSVIQAAIDDADAYSRTLGLPDAPGHITHHIEMILLDMIYDAFSAEEGEEDPTEQTETPGCYPLADGGLPTEPTAEAARIVSEAKAEAVRMSDTTQRRDTMDQTANQKFVAQVMAEIITNHRDDATFDKILKSLLDDTGHDKLTNAMVRASIILDGVHPQKTLKAQQMLVKALKNLIANDDWITIIAAAKRVKKMIKYKQERHHGYAQRDY